MRLKIHAYFQHSLSEQAMECVNYNFSIILQKGEEMCMLQPQWCFSSATWHY